jgi:rare lipoprotein A
LIGLALLTACTTGPTAVPDPRYVLGQPYRSSGVWHYPHEEYDLSETGLAQAMTANHPPLTSNGERFDPMAMAAAHSTLQLPAIARVTNLETGRAVLVRINDRGSGNPRRLIEVTPRVGALLGMADSGIGRVRVQVLPSESHAAVDGLPDAPLLAVAAAPRRPVEISELPSLPGTRQGRGYALSGKRDFGVDLATRAPPMRLPETVTQGAANPGRLWVRLGSFEEYQYAAALRARLIGLSPRVEQVSKGRARLFRVGAGPFDSVRQVDAALDQALAAGIPDARIVVE